jgi:hypothetical protein
VVTFPVGEEGDLLQTNVADYETAFFRSVDDTVVTLASKFPTRVAVGGTALRTRRARGCGDVGNRH